MDVQGIIHKVCRIYCDEEEQRKDLFQEILIHLWKAYPGFKGESKFSTWIYRISLNVVFQHFRKQKRKPVEETLSDEHERITEQNDRPLHNDEVKILHHAIGRLNDIEKAIVMLYLEEKGYEEIAEITGITRNYVRVRMNRIKIKLGKLMKPLANGAH